MKYADAIGKGEKGKGENGQRNADGTGNLLAFPRSPLLHPPAPFSRDQEPFNLLDPLRAESVFLG